MKATFSIIAFASLAAGVPVAGEPSGVQRFEDWGYYSAEDGTAIPVPCIGPVTMGIGFALTEGRILDRKQTGKLVNKNWHDYKLPTMLDVPNDRTSFPIDRPDPEANLTGAKGLGEPVTIPTAAAIGNVVYHATGVRVFETPMTPPPLVKLFSQTMK